MMIELDDEYLRQLVRASRKADLGLALEQYLYGDPRFDVNREQELGRTIVKHMVEQLRKAREGGAG